MLMLIKFHTTADRVLAAVISTERATFPLVENTRISWAFSNVAKTKIVIIIDDGAHLVPCNVCDDVT